MNSSKDTKTETGLPGRPKKGLPSTSPKAWGAPGCMDTLYRSMVPSPSRILFTTSRCPTETPPEVMKQSASASPPAMAARSLASSSSTIPRRLGTAPASARQPHSVKELASGICP